MGHVVDFKMGRQSVPQRFIVNPQLVTGMPRGLMRGDRMIGIRTFTRSRRGGGLLLRLLLFRHLRQCALPRPARMPVPGAARDRQKEREAQSLLYFDRSPD